MWLGMSPEPRATASDRTLASAPKRYPVYRDSGIEWLGNVPEGWKPKRLKYVASMNAETLPQVTDPNYVLRYIDIGDIDADGRLLGSEEMPFAEAPSRARRLVRHGDTILSTVRTYLRAITFIQR